jgi:CCR4-NOT transcription complex subunit 7/8
VVARPVGPFKDGPDYNYQRIKCNVDLLKVIQIGLTFSDPDGRLPTEDGHPFDTWQFNFKFDLSYDLHAADSVQFLQNCGIDFAKHCSDGIDPTLFGELLMSSGIVLSEEVRWIAFQGKYDFGYFIKILSCDALPPTQEQFFDLLHTYFPNIYDIKWLLHNVHHDLEEEVNAIAARSTGETPLSPSAVAPNLVLNLKAQKDKGLEDLAKTLGIPRVGTAHQAGSDSLLTCEVFFRLVHRHLPNVLNEDEDSSPAPAGHHSPVMTPVHNGSRYRSASAESDGLLAERQRKRVHFRNVLHGLGRGYIQPDRDQSQLSQAAASAAQNKTIGASSPVGLQRAPQAMVPPTTGGLAPPPLTGTFRFGADAATATVVGE